MNEKISSQDTKEHVRVIRVMGHVIILCSFSLHVDLRGGQIKIVGIKF